MDGQRPAFTLIVSDYHDAVSGLRREACLLALQASTWRDFEVLWYHDGPAPREVQQRLEQVQASDSRFQFMSTARRHNDWGHSLRDRGITEANGHLLVHLNADNLLYPQALSVLQAYRQHSSDVITLNGLEGSKLQYKINPQVLIFTIRLMGCVALGHGLSFVRCPGQEAMNQLIFPGWPPEPGRIDAMQLVTTKENWLAIGGWFDKSETSDGVLLQKLANRFGYYVIPEILGEHW